MFKHIQIIRMNIADLLKYYNNDEILNELINQGKDREVATMFSKGFFGQRPSILMYKQEIIDQVRNGAVSFHMSVELWKNPMSLNATNSKNEMNELRKGWDLIIDIDTKIFDYAKICATLLCHALEYHSIKNYAIKYSGGTGFHIAVPYECFPKTINGVSVKKLFPEAAQKIASYLSAFVRKKLSEMILELNSVEQIINKTSKTEQELFENNEFNPYAVLEIDAAALSPRHLMRMPYSINEKKGLVSLPIKKEDIINFEIESAKPKNVNKVVPFIQRDKAIANEANDLFMQAYDYFKKIEKKITKPVFKKRVFEKNYKKIPPEKYPPCIKLILKGLDDGKKRALFILVNYFKSANYSKEEIVQIITKWNSKNPEPLKESYVKSQINWNLRSTEYLAPNCDNKMYYQDLAVCKKDNICENIKNPINYHFRVYSKKKRIKKEKNFKKEKRIIY
jgi:DNA primase catalytic subunit